MVQVGDTIREINSQNEKIDSDFLYHCIKSGDVWELSNYEDDPDKIYFLKYRISTEEIIIWDKNQNTIFSGKLPDINKDYFECLMTKVSNKKH